MAKIFIDGKSYDVDADDNLLHAALSLGLNLPYFCWHPAMGSVGACRQCAVKQFKDEKDTRGRLVMACMTPAAEGTRISIEDQEAVDFRASVIEWLMLNHPHDCPVCEEGGECHLQDMTVMTGHVRRRTRFKKRTYRNQYLGPFIGHEMNRCIQCYRCVRFYRDYAGGRDLDVFASHDHVYFGRHEDGVLENEFSGNLVEICPTGVFVDKTFSGHYARKWDLQTAPSICTGCGLGCNIIPAERYGTLRRIENRYHEELNGYFICDRGRYGYEFVNSAQRIRNPRLNPLSERKPSVQTHWSSAGSDDPLLFMAEAVQPGTPLIGIGSPRASLEANFALRLLVGPQNFFGGVSANEARLTQQVLNIIRKGSVPIASLREVEDSDAVLILGEDLLNTAPRLALAVRQAVRNQPIERAASQKKIDHWNDSALRDAIQDQHGPLYMVTPAATGLDDVATSTMHLAPDDIARFGFEVAFFLDGKAPRAKWLTSDPMKAAEDIAQVLRDARRPVVIAGTSLGNEAILQAAANIAQALKAMNSGTHLVFTVPESNSLGLAMLDDKDLEQAAQALEQQSNATLVILENNLYRRAERAFVDRLLSLAEHVVVLDSLENEITARADVILPAATFAEGDGTLINYETRAQRFFQVITPTMEGTRESWRWLREMMRLGGHEQTVSWNELDDVLQTIAEREPIFAPILEIAPPEDFRMAGQKIPRQPHRYSGRTAIYADITVHEPKPPDDPDAPLAFSMEGYKGEPPPSLLARYWKPGWNSVQALNKFQDEVGESLKGGDPGQRLIVASAEATRSYFEEVPKAFQLRRDEYLVLPRYHIFGSEEHSRLSPAVAERIPESYVSMSSQLAQRLKATEGQRMVITFGTEFFHLPVHLDDSLPEGAIGLPAGFPGIPVGLPAWAKLELDSEAMGI